MNSFRGDDLAAQFARYGSDNAVTPPDTTVGTGNGFVVQPLNNSLSIYSSAGALLHGVDLNAFYAAVLPPNHNVTDPQAVYDSVTSGRFYMTMLGFDRSTDDSEVLLAVSQTGDPTGNWVITSLGTTPGLLQDQPLLGISNDKVTISVNDFTLQSGFVGSVTYVLNKAELDTGGVFHGMTFGPESDWRPAPARSTSSTTTQFVVSLENDVTSSLDVMAITGVPTATTQPSRTITTLGISQTTVPPSALQPGQGSPSISTNEPGTLEAVWQNGVLWAGSNDGCILSGDTTTRACLRLLQLAAPVSGAPSLTQDVDLGSAGDYLYFPGVAMDESQNLHVPASISNASSINPSGAVVTLPGGQINGATVQILQSGSQYDGLDSGSPPVRWGDYSGAAIDPGNPGDVWVATEFGGGDTSLGTATNWATQLSRITLPGVYHPLTPTRITDTRPGSGFPNAGRTLGAGTSLNVQVDGQGTVPGSGVGAAVLNVTATGPTEPSFLTVWPTGAPRPTASNLNFVPHQTVPNLVEVGLGINGGVSVYNSAGSVDVVVDVEGYVGPSATAGTGLYNPLTPARITDTRPGSGQPNAGNTLGPGTVLNVQVTNAGGVPSTGVAAAVLDVTATDPTNPSFLTVWPAGGSPPTASNLNFVPGQTVPNRVMVPVGSNGQVSIFNSAGAVDVVVDVGGYFTDSSNPSATGSHFTPNTPVRITDTRPGSGFPNAGNTLGPQGTLDVHVAGIGGVPGTAVAGVMNVTATNTTRPSFLTVWPTGVTQPLASDLNWVAGETVPNLVVVGLGSDGAVQVLNSAGSVDVVVDVSGWYW